MNDGVTLLLAPLLRTEVKGSRLDVGDGFIENSKKIKFLFLHIYSKYILVTPNQFHKEKHWQWAQNILRLISKQCYLLTDEVLDDWRTVIVLGQDKVD